jgi:hypothetical protein
MNAAKAVGIELGAIGLTSILHPCSTSIYKPKPVIGDRAGSTHEP